MHIKKDNKKKVAAALFMSSLTMYLLPSTFCHPVHSPLCRVCRNASYIQAESPGGYIASVSSEETGCGRKGCPWVLQAQAGQRLNITLLDFALSTRHRDQVPAAVICPLAPIVSSTASIMLSQAYGELGSFYTCVRYVYSRCL